MTTAREKLLSAAEERFYNNGINATGIDSITTDAGVAKKSLYNNFSSKAALVDAYIEQRHQEWLSLYRAREAQAASAIEKSSLYSMPISTTQCTITQIVSADAVC
ncbi:TetR/AcrR family transcriptional regulator [Corynebacterium stationis]|uniref:TetR/AcrR family transcriptional regulator n=1 Tax=Corynebacterium stationis TaxID=1705 RepID=UPI001E3FBAD4|nr:TetR/AcrR family transcriptional regulator [Corynebacterium stationis]